MPASFNGNNGNDGNDGNNGNNGNSGNSSSSSGGWFFPDRVNLPFITEPSRTQADPAGGAQTIGQLAPIRIATFPGRNWATEWHAWLALTEFTDVLARRNGSCDLINVLDPNQGDAASFWPIGVPFPPPEPLIPLPDKPFLTGVDWTVIGPLLDPPQATEIVQLVTAATNERADAMGQILSQSDEFISVFLNLMTTRPGAYPQTTTVLAIASLIGTFVAMKYKRLYGRPRPSQLCPALLPPIAVPGHASFPSGHSTQAHLMALCLGDVAGTPQDPTMAADLWTLADCIARNREIAGLHYPSDSEAGIAFAISIHAMLQVAGNNIYIAAVAAAAKEWA